VQCSEPAAASAALGPLSSSPPRRTDQLLLHLGALLALLLLLPGLQVVALLLVRIRMRSPHACCRVLQQMRFHGGSDTAAELDGFEWLSSSARSYELGAYRTCVLPVVWAPAALNSPCRLTSDKRVS
jgi:hypothetical protein